MPETQLSTAVLRPDGRQLVTPAMQPDRFAYRVELQGTYRFGYTGETFDAVYRDRGTGRFSERHSYLRWEPAGLVLETEDPAAHRYAWRVPAEAARWSQSLGVAFDVDRLVYEHLIPPSEVRGQLTGELRLRVLQTPLAPPNPWPQVIGGTLPGVLILGGLGLVIRRRMAHRGLPEDVILQLDRIQRKSAAARAVITREHDRLLPLTQRVTELQRGAADLGTQIRSLRQSRGLVDRDGLEGDIRHLEGQFHRPEAAAALQEKRRNILLLDELEQQEEACRLRLARVEALLDSTCLTLRGTDAAGAGTAPDALCRDLDAELSAIREMARDHPPAPSVLQARR